MHVKVLKQLCGLSESGHSWYHKYKDSLKNRQKVSTTDEDLSFHYKHHDSTKNIQGTMVVYVDDTLASGNEQFEKRKARISKTFESKKKAYTPFGFCLY